jgi:hypothetical protein
MEVLQTTKKKKMFRLFGGRTIKRAVGKVLAERVKNAQLEYNESEAELDAVLRADIEEAKARNRAEKEKTAAELAARVLGQ